MNASLLCFAELVQDIPDGKLNLLGVFEQMEVSAFPAQPRNFNLVMKFDRNVAKGHSEHKISVSIIGDKDECLLEEDGEFVMPASSPDSPSTVTLIWYNSNILFPKGFVYSFKVRVDDGDSLMRTLQLPVMLKQA